MTDLAEWAKRFPIGTPVLYFPVRGDFEYKATRIRSEPWMTSHPIVKVEGVAGGVLIDHIQPFPQLST
jgi:hypothetical protein